MLEDLDVAAEHERLLGQSIAHAGRPDGERRRSGKRARPAPEAERHQIGHAEERAHAADLHDVVGLAWEAPWRRLPMSVVVPPTSTTSASSRREKGGPAHGSGRPRPKE